MNAAWGQYPAMKFAPLIALGLLAPAARAGDVLYEEGLGPRADAVFEALRWSLVVLLCGLAVTIVIGAYVMLKTICPRGPGSRTVTPVTPLPLPNLV